MANNNCPDCGANLAMVGRMHRCISRVVAGSPCTVTTDSQVGRRARESAKPVQFDSASAGVPEVAVGARGTYRYRNADSRRAYMRDYMRTRRGLKIDQSKHVHRPSQKEIQDG